MSSEPCPNIRNAVIIGGGVAGTACGAELSAMLSVPSLQVTLIDPQPAVKISTLAAKLTRTAIDVTISERDAVSWCEEHGITFVRDCVVQLHKSSVRCASGTIIPFHVCCIATGARPYVPPALRQPDIADRIVTLRDLDSVAALQAMLAVSKRVVIVGGGAIAMELVHEMSGCEVVWVMKGGHLGGAFFDRRAAKCLQTMFGLAASEVSTVDTQPGVVENSKRSAEVCWGGNEVRCNAPGSGVGPDWISRRFEPVLLDAKGQVQPGSSEKAVNLRGMAKEKQVKVVRNAEITSVRRLQHGEWTLAAILSDGTTVVCDLIVAGTGVVPNVEWLRGSGVEVCSAGQGDENDDSGGVVVSGEGLETGMKGVFAAGDCAIVRGNVGQDWLQMRLWSQAVSMGRVCARAMCDRLGGEAGEGIELELFAHVTKFFGRKVVLLGRYSAQGLGHGYEMLESGGGEGEQHYVRAVLKDGKVRGALLVGEVDAAETFENLILDGLDVSAFGAELVDPNIDVDDYFD